MTQTGTNVVESILNSIEWFEKEIKNLIQFYFYLQLLQSENTVT